MRLGTSASENGAPIPLTSPPMKWKPDCPSRKQKWITRPFTKRGNEHFDWPGGLLQAHSEGNKNFLILRIFAEQMNLVTTPIRSQVKTSVDKIYWPKSNGLRKGRFSQRNTIEYYDTWERSLNLSIVLPLLTLPYTSCFVLHRPATDLLLALN